MSFGVAQAAVVKYDFTFSGTNGSGSGSLTASANADGSFTAISGAGTETYLGVNASFSLLFNPAGSATSNYFFPNGAWYFYDNTLFPSAATKLNNGGLLFSSTSSSYSTFNLFSTASGAYTYSNASAAGDFSPRYDSSFTLVENTAVPEPASLALFGLGCLGLAACRRKSRHLTPA